MGSCSKQQQRMLQDDFDDYTGYRLMYHVEKFIAGWRNLVLFYLAMFIAGYAQVVDSFLFWGAVTALLLVYWEPYLSPPFPWTSDGSSSEDDLTQHTVQKWGSRPTWMHPASKEEKQAVRQWLYCLRRGLPQKQQMVHRVMQCCIVLPCVSMGVGVIMQKVYAPLADDKAMYYSAILFTLMVIYTLLTVGANLACFWLVRRKLVPAAVAEDWQPQDMMYFICKILGEFLNTVVQTLVAGAFVAYMPKTIFWLGAVITGMSYTATNLLFDMGPGAPVQDEEVDSHWLTNCACCTGGSAASIDDKPHPYDSKPDSYTAHSTTAAGAGCSDGDSAAQRGVDSASSAFGSAAAAAAAAAKDDDVVLSLDCAEAANFTGNKATRLRSQSEDCETCSEVSRMSAGNGGDDSPPFLMYKWPKGVRGWSIIALLILQAGPCIAILAMLTIGKYKNMPHLYLDDREGACIDKCFKRYEQLLYALVCLGILTCYYAFTIGFLGCGPVTFVYRYLYHGCFKRAAKSKL